MRGFIDHWQVSQTQCMHNILGMALFGVYALIPRFYLPHAYRVSLNGWLYVTVLPTPHKCMCMKWWSVLCAVLYLYLKVTTRPPTSGARRSWAALSWPKAVLVALMLIPSRIHAYVVLLSFYFYPVTTTPHITAYRLFKHSCITLECLHSVHCVYNHINSSCKHAITVF